MWKQCLEIIPCKDLEEVSARGAAIIVARAAEAVRACSRFTMALSGGSTPKSLYRLLASEEYRKQIEWGKVHFFWGDERCVAPDHSDSNYRMVRETFLSNTAVPMENIHPIPGELGADAAAEYEKKLRDFFACKGEDLPSFDLVLLGMGDDGHMASLFPGTKAIEEKEKFVTDVYVEKLRSSRISLTAPVLNNARNIILLVSGERKASVLKSVLEGEMLPELYPVQFLRKARGRVTWIIDEAAGSQLS